jgi:outer membrane protein assembly factor BamB
MKTDVNNLVFVGLNSRIAALDLDTGQLVWPWRATTPRSGGYVSLLLLDATRLIVSVNGYTYCLDPRTGEQHWYNELSGFGTGVTSIATLGKNNLRDLLLAAAAADAAAAAASAADSSLAMRSETNHVPTEKMAGSQARYRDLRAPGWTGSQGPWAYVILRHRTARY